MPGALPPALRSVLDAATSEAKRRGHGVVLPAHLAAVLLQGDGARGREAFPKSFATILAGVLDALPRTYAAPAVDPRTDALLTASAGRADPLAALTDAVRVAVEVAAGDGDDRDGAAGSPAAASLAAGSPPAGSPPAGSPTRGSPTSGAAAAGPEAAGTAGDARELPDVAAPQPFALTGRAAGAAEVVDTSPPLLPRTDVVLRLAAMLGARRPQTPLVVAAEGSGRSTLAECLSAFLHRLPAGDLAGMPVVRVRPQALVDGARGAGLAEVLAQCRGRAVAVVDDLETLAMLGTGSPDLGMLLPLRAATTADDRVVLVLADRYVDRLQAADRELVDCLERVDVPAMADAEVLQVVRARARELAAHHGVVIDESVVATAAAPPRQIDVTGHPALAVARLDRAAAAAAMRADRTAHADDLGAAVSGQQYVAFDPVRAAERLGTTVLGQDSAIDAVVNRLAVTRAALDLRPERPDGVFLFAGPTGTGKTALALALAQEIYGSDQAVIRLDMSEFAEEHTVSKLVGAPPGYVGSTDPESWLTTQVRRRPQSVLLLDEIEKAHPVVWNTFLQVFDAGRLTDRQGRTADFRDVVVVLTTNIGSEAFADGASLGFVERPPDGSAEQADVMRRLKERMRPELLNRIDEILVFRPLGVEVVRRIAALRLEEALARLASRGWSVRAGADVVDLLARRGFTREYGARPLLRVIESLLLRPAARLAPGSYDAVVDGEVLDFRAG